MKNRSDEKLVSDYLSGDEGALRLLFERHLKPIYNFVYAYVKNRGDAEDITQDAFMRAWKSLSKFDQSKKFKTWIFEIAKNASLNWIKKKKPLLFGELQRDGDGESPENLFKGNEPLPEEVFDRKNLPGELSEAMGKLNHNHRQIIVLRHNDHLNFREISEIMGRPLNTVKSAHRRAILALKRALLDENAPKLHL